MTCFNPKKAWKLNFNSLDIPAQLYEKQKKITFRRPTNLDNYQELEIPCGICLGCKLDLANSWATRIMLECKDHKENSFITLTYDNKYLPIRNNHITLCKKDIQDFIKRLRFRLNKKISYFACGEYGPKTHRPHYHLIVFGYKPKDLKLHKFSATENNMYISEELAKIWGKGYVCVEDVNYKSACYTARYVQKKAGIQPNKRILTGEKEEIEKLDERTGEIYTSIVNKRLTEKYDKWGREKEFILMSKKPAIGLNYWNKNKDIIKRNKGILIKIDDKTTLKPIPRYFKKIWEKEDYEELYTYKHQINQNMQKKRDETLSKISLSSEKCEEMTEIDKKKLYNKFQELNLKERGRYLKRNQI